MRGRSDSDRARFAFYGGGLVALGLGYVLGPEARAAVALLLGAGWAYYGLRVLRIL
jgi:hypothetical protein